MMSFTPQIIQASKNFDSPGKEKGETEKAQEELYAIEVKLDTATALQALCETDKPADNPPVAVPEVPQAETPEAPKNTGPAQWEELFEKAVRLHKEAAEGSKGAAREVYGLLKRVREMAPGNSLVEAYYGSATAMQGRDASDIGQRMEMTQKGLEILDRSISADPENIDIRVLRANLCHRLPGKYFHRTATAVADFSYLAERYERDPGVLSPQLYWQVLYDLGKALKKLYQEILG